MPNNDDTQPRSPFTHTPAEKTPPSGMSAVPSPDLTPATDEDGIRGPGCFVWGVLSLIIIVFALVIVGLAGTAGYTAGVRVRETDSTETQNFVINDQLARIPTDVANQNQMLVYARLDFLSSLTPAIPQVPSLQETATALALNMRPTATFTPTATLEITPTLVIIETEDVLVEQPTENTSPFDVSALLVEAQRSFNLAQYEDAIETLDNIIRIDDQYQRQLVRQLMFDSLVRQATILYGSLENIAEAIALTDRAEEFGSIALLDISYERSLGQLYLDAILIIDLGDHLGAIQALNEIRQYQIDYKGVDIMRLLFAEYVAYGNAFVAGGQPCQAVGQFNTALTFFTDSGVAGSRDAAQTACEQGTATPVGEGNGDVAPVGEQSP